MTIFQRIGCRMTKMNITFSMKNGIPNTALKLFSSKTPHTGWIKAKKPVLGAHFPQYQCFYWTDGFQKNRFHSSVSSHQPCEFHENRFKTTTCILTVIIIISWKSRSAFLNVNWRTSTRVLLLESILIWRKILWRINFILIKFLLNALHFEKS